MRLFTECRLGSATNNVILNDEVCYRPDDYVISYISRSFGLFRNGYIYSTVLDTLDFFLKSFPLLKDESIIKSIKSSDMVFDLLEFASEILDDNSSSVAAIEHASQLLNHKEEIVNIWNKVSKVS